MSIDQFHAEFKEAKRKYIEPNREKTLDRALAEFKEARRRLDEPTSGTREYAEYEAKRLAYNALLSAIYRAEAEAADRARIEAHDKYYRDREERIEAERLALEEQRKWDQRWLHYRYNNGPKPEPLPLD